MAVGDSAGAGSVNEFGPLIPVPRGGARWRRALAFLGPGYLISVGYMDPGNWATDLGGGSAYGERLLSVVVASSLMAILLQYLSLRLGIATGLDLAQHCRRAFSRPVTITLWILAEIGIVACDLAEVLGTAIALELLFGLPLFWGVLVTAGDTLLVLGLERWGFRTIEALVMVLIATIAICFAIELSAAHPSMTAILDGLVPDRHILTDPGALMLSVGILGATVMPHNLYLHSALVRSRRIAPGEAARGEAMRFAALDSTVALTIAGVINAAILILAATVFYRSGHTDVAEIQDAYRLLAPLLGLPAAAVLFAVALLASGQNSTLTGTLAGQVVMEGFIDLRLPPWQRRLITRLLAVAPAALVVGWAGEAASGKLLIASQVVLSLQLPFAMVPLILFTGQRRVMGSFTSGRVMQGLAWVVAAVVIALNLILLADTAGLV